MTKFSQDEIKTRPDGIRAQELADIQAAATVTIPGGVLLTTEERMFRDGIGDGRDRAVIVARSILTKVRNAVTGEGT